MSVPRTWHLQLPLQFVDPGSLCLPLQSACKIGQYRMAAAQHFCACKPEVCSHATCCLSCLEGHGVFYYQQESALRVGSWPEEKEGHNRTSGCVGNLGCSYIAFITGMYRMMPAQRKWLSGGTWSQRRKEVVCAIGQRGILQLILSCKLRSGQKVHFPGRYMIS